MAEIETSVLRIGSNDLVLQDGAARGSLANAYSASSTYAVGDYVLYGGQLYECNTAISTAEAWTAAHWTAVTVGGELSTVKDGLQAVETQIIATLITDTASGAIASFPDGADNVPVKSLTVDIEPVQSGSGDPSPDNVRPISGHTSAVVTRTGANVWDEEWELGVWSGSGAKVPSNTAIRSVNYIPVLSNAVYYCYFASRYTSGLIIRQLDASKQFLTTTTLTVSGTFTTSANCRFIVLCTYGDNNITTYNHDISINYPSTETAYHAYTGEEYEIDLDGTRYGGTLDVGTGVLTVDRALVTLNGTETWNTNTAAAGLYYTSIIGIPTNIETGVISNAFILTTASGVNMTDGQMKKVRGSLFVNFKYSPATTLDAWKTWLGANNVQLVYPLATPQTVQLTAQQLSTLLGQNNIWSDTGDTTVEYRADTKLYIQKMLSS